ncbi:MAG TPA: ribosome biogenesis factor YjgA [Gammaproteobacteria bacterium]|nr:ribosome biogenesis factor YjgA [Gammaproteobacteria bacterium]
MVRKSRRSIAAIAEQGAAAGNEPHEDVELEEGSSRTERKNASRALTRLGEGLLTLRHEKLAALALPDRLLEALTEAKRLTSFASKRRQIRFIGKLMRDLDETAVAGIRKALRPR